MLIRHFMTREVLTVDPSTPCAEVLKRMRAQRIRRAPVVAGDKLVGIVAERDLIGALSRSVGEIDSERGQAADARPVEEIMHAPVITVGQDDHLEFAAQIMLERKIGGIPVLDRGRLVGILTESDIFRAFVRMTQPGRGLRVTLERPERAPRFDPIDVARGLGLEVRGYVTHPAFGGREMIVLRVEGSRARELPRLLIEAGWVVVECDGGAARERVTPGAAPAGL